MYQNFLVQSLPHLISSLIKFLIRPPIKATHVPAKQIIFIMKTLIILLSLLSVSLAQLGLLLPAGTTNFELPIHASDAKAFTRKLSNGQMQTWNLEGPNKGTWVDAKGKKVPSSNFVIVAPATLKIKKVTKGDAGFYDYVSKLAPVKFDLPPGVHVDPGVPSGVELTVN
ncbi:hypothetical protein L5515_009508 [Caenorhabditis briggsae]|uniref:Uncharacterized protein n=1 Tax=Caenorhabditis briggsae TaxID=6238 RepID=A0AAE9F8X6_CAEBR|nr:hypothetical protein L5515_009508 [Caenorhabditis briggsae]